MTSRDSTFIRTSLAAAGLTLACSAAHAAAWEFNPTVEAGYLYDDNYRLTSPGTEIEVQGGLLDAELEMRSLMPSSEFSFTPRVRMTYFPDETEVDSQDYFATLNWEHRGQRLRTRLRGEFAEQDVINSEQPDAEPDSDLGEPVFGDAGRVIVTNRRLRASLRPTLDYELSERRTLQFGARYTDVSFDTQINTAQVGYTAANIEAGLLFRTSERSSFTTRVRGAQYDIDTQPDTATSYGAEVQWDTRNEAETRTFLRAGAESVELNDGSSETAWLAGAGVSMQLGRNQLFADLSRSVGPSSAGIVVARDQLRLRFSRDITPRLAFLAGVRGTHDADVDEESTFSERSYATGDVGMQWRWEEELALRVTYDYTWQEFDDAPEDATSSGAMISILYQPLQRRR